MNKRGKKSNMVKVGMAAGKIKGPGIVGKKLFNKQRALDEGRDASPNPLQAVKRQMKPAPVCVDSAEPVAEIVDDDQIEKDTRDMYK